jgi:3-methyladenine DNA glycosylase AlkD
VYYEENNLHMELLCLQKVDFSLLLQQLEDFLPYIDNWATCDGRAATLVAKNPAQAQAAAVHWLQSDREYTVRFGLVTLLSFVKTAFVPEHLMLAAWTVLAGPCQTAYYVRMAAAWYFSMALVHQWGAALPWIVENRLPVGGHNKTVQKACESYQLTQAQKQLLRGCKRPDKEE